MEQFFTNIVHTALWALLVMAALAVVGVVAIVRTIVGIVNTGEKAVQTTIHDVKIRSKEMAHSDFHASAEKAAESLDKMFRGSDWYLATGTAANGLIVYVKATPPEGTVPEDRSGHPVKIVTTGIVRAN